MAIVCLEEKASYMGDKNRHGHNCYFYSVNNSQDHGFNRNLIIFNSTQRFDLVLLFWGATWK
jgi:hypothetical protein